jgi:uncharacterized tellurite resistance protein B-like protein
MFIRKLFGLQPQKESGPDADTQTVRRIVQELEAMEPAKARYVAAFAFILGRVAHADANISADETREMERTVERWGDVPGAQAVLIVEIAKAQASLFGATEDFLVTRQFKDLSTPAQREHLLHCLFAVSAADDSISSVEEGLVRQIAGELGVFDRDFIAIRSVYNDKRAALKNLPDTK